MRTRLTVVLGNLKRRSSRPTTRPHTPWLPETEPEAIVNAFNELESSLDGLRDAGRRLTLVSESLRTTSREIKASTERLEQPPFTDLVPPTPERPTHLRLLKTVA